MTASFLSPSRRRSGVLAVGLLLGFVIAQASSAWGQLVLVQDSTAGTGDARVAQGCYRLSSTVGEAVAAPTTAGNLKLFSGFWGAVLQAAQRDSIFSNGFEDCGP